ncbi:phytoene desaturase family protein [Luedemannella flava]
MRTPPKVASRRPGDLIDQLRLVWGMRGLDVRRAADAVRLFTMSIADVLDEWFSSEQLKGVMAVNGIIGTWAGPCAPGTAYVMMHHTIGDLGDGAMGQWGYPVGGMGAVSAAIRASAESFGATVLTDSSVERILVADNRVTGVVTTDGREYHAPIVLAATHPAITFLRQIARDQLPSDFVTDIERWRTRSGSVKVNVALSGLPRFAAAPDMPLEHYSGAIELAPSLDYLERAFTDAREGAPPRGRSRTAPSPRRWTRRCAPRAPTSCRCSPSGCRTPGRPSRTATNWRRMPTGSSRSSRRTRRASPT